MMRFEYKVIKAPDTANKIKGVKDPGERFAQTLEEMLNEYGATGWEFVRAEVLDFEEKSGMFSRGSKGEDTYLIFKRSKDHSRRIERRADEDEEFVDDGPRLGGAFRD